MDDSWPSDSRNYLRRRHGNQCCEESYFAASINSAVGWIFHDRGLALRDGNRSLFHLSAGANKRAGAADNRVVALCRFERRAWRRRTGAESQRHQTSDGSSISLQNFHPHIYVIVTGDISD